MAAMIHAFGGRRGAACPFALCALVALLAAALLSLAPAAADGHPDGLRLALSVVDDSDNIVPAGSEIEIRAELRFSQQAAAAPPDGVPSFIPYALGVPQASTAISRLRMSGQLVWEGPGRRRLEIAAQTLLPPVRVPGAPGANRYVPKALDKRSLITRGNNSVVYVFDSYTLEHAASIIPPDTSSGDYHTGFGASDAGGMEGGYSGTAVAVWHETDARAWLFIGSWHDTVETHDEMGRLYIYRLDWDDDGATVTPQGTMEPTAAEAGNRHAGAFARYGGAVAISRDGSTLAVSATAMNVMGAIYVYSRPDGPDEDWGDIAYADGVKVTAGAVPSLGTSRATQPFDETVAYDASAPRSCSAWCSYVWSSIATSGDNGAGLGAYSVSLSADGSVLAAGAHEKEYSVTTPGGGFTGANRRNNAGEVFVWLAPEGGWQNAPRADRDADGNAKTLIDAKADASSFRRATHYSPGPLRRVTEPAAILVNEAWPGRLSQHFGLETAISPDGSTVAVESTVNSGSVLVYQLDSANDWKTIGGSLHQGHYWAESTAPLSARVAEWRIGSSTFIRNTPTTFNYDGTQIATGDLNHNSNAGSLVVFLRESNGRWRDSTPRVRLTEPTVGNQRFWGHAAQELSGRRALVGASFTGGTYMSALTARPVGNCALSTIDGVKTFSCPIDLSNSTIVIPAGTPDGETFSIFGTVALKVAGKEDVVATLTDALEVTIDTVDELAEVEFDFAIDESTGQPWPSVVGPGESTTLLLKLLNEHGKASATGSIASLLATTNSGALSARLGDANAEACAADGGQACRIANPTTALTGSNADQIRLTVTHPGAAKSGEATVRVDVVAAADGQAIATEPLRITFSGAPTALAISEPPTAVLGHAPTDSADLRNKATLVVSATDAGGNKATVPDSAYSAKLTDSDGKTITSQQAELTWPLRKGGDGDDADNLVLRDGNPQARVTIAAAASSPLAAGEYTLELSAGSAANKLTATQTVNVAGGAEEVSLSADPAGDIEEGATVTITATVTDVSGVPVPDGTPVHFTEGTSGSNVVLVLASPSRQRTSGGQAAVQLRAVGRGSAYVQARSDGAGGLQVIRVTAPAPPPLADLAAGFTANSFETWPHTHSTTAAALYNAMDGVAQIRKWDGIEWISYGESSGLLLPGSIDFIIARGDILWLDGG